MNLNKAQLIGRVTKDPGIRSTPSGTKMATFGLATNHTYKNANGEKVEEVDFHNIVCFGRTAEIVEQYVTKGQLLYVEGRVRNSSYEDKQGVKKYKTDIIVQSLQMGPKSAGGGNGRPKEENHATGQIERQNEENQEDNRSVDTVDGEPAGEIDVKDIPF